MRSTKRKPSPLATVTHEGRSPHVQPDELAGLRRARAPQGDQSVSLMARIPRDDLKWLRQHALDRGESLAALIRRLVADYRAAHSR
jgi:hypothetical protein